MGQIVDRDLLLVHRQKYVKSVTDGFVLSDTPEEFQLKRCRKEELKRGNAGRKCRNPQEKS